jgi:hypothetical protein
MSAAARIMRDAVRGSRSMLELVNETAYAQSEPA